MFRKKLNVDDMSSEEMYALRSRLVKRLLWLNGLWLLFVVAMLFWIPVVGVILLIITGAKYFHDYHDVESQAQFAEFEGRAFEEKARELESDIELLQRRSKSKVDDERRR